MLKRYIAKTSTLNLLSFLRAISRKKLKWPFFDVKMRQNGFFFRIPHEKLGKKCYGKFFFLVIWGSNMGSNMGSKIDHFTKIGQNRQNCIFFIGKRLRVMRIRFSTRFWQNKICDYLILQLRLQIGQSRHPNFGIF